MPLPFLALAGASKLAKRGLKRGRRATGRSRGSARRGGAPRRRRSRARLTATEREELLWVKNNIGKTAAAQLLPTFMRRG